MWKESVARELRSVATCGCTCIPRARVREELHLPAPNGTRRGGGGAHGRGAQRHLAKGALVDGEGALAEGVRGSVVAEARLDDREIVEGDCHLRARRALSNGGRETMREKRQPVGGWRKLQAAMAARAAATPAGAPGRERPRGCRAPPRAAPAPCQTPRVPAPTPAPGFRARWRPPGASLRAPPAGCSARARRAAAPGPPAPPVATRLR